MLNRKMLPGCATFLAILASSNVFSDVTMKQNVKVDAGGAMSFMGASGTLTTYISSDKSRSESEMEPASGLMGSFMPNMDSYNIVRLDKDLTWQLQPDKQRYSEMTLEQMRVQMEESAAQLEEMQQEGGGALPVSEESCQWSDPQMDIRDTGEKQRFANVKAEQHIITIRETCTVPDSDQTCVMTWTMEHWMAKRMPGEDETRAFHQAFAEKLGIEDMMSGVPAASRGLLLMFKEGWEEAVDEAGELKGYPVKTVMQMEMGGESCTATSGQPIAMDDIWGNAMDASIDASAQSAGSAAGQKIGQEAGEAMGDSVGGSIGGAAVGAASSEVIGGLLKRFRKKKKEPEPEPAAEAQPNPAAGAVVLFRISTELTDIDEGEIPAERFELPEGWEKTN